ncbi:hypothetical protein BCR44DRAFT_44272, partial [Catenaria anguillulae PL171]
MANPPPAPTLTLDLAELVLIHALRTFLPGANCHTDHWRTSLSSLLNTLGPRASFPLITTTAVYRCLSFSDYYHDLVFAKNDADLLALTLRIWRRKPGWRIAPRSAAYCSPVVLVGAVRAGRAEVVGEWLALAADERVPLRKRGVGNAIRACIRFGQWDVLREIMASAPRLDRMRNKVSAAWMWRCALLAALVYYPNDMNAAVDVMDKVREVHRALYIADRERMAAEIKAIGHDNQAARKAYAYIGQPSWRVLVDSLRFMQGVLASALRCKQPERILMWWFRFDDELKAWDEERVRVHVVGLFRKEGVDAVVRWWYKTHKVRRKPRHPRSAGSIGMRRGG